MESAECSLDELLCQSLLQYRQFRLYDARECEDAAYRILKETRMQIDKTQNGIDTAKWGCVIECLAHKYYIDSNTDDVLRDIDAVLVGYWKKVGKTSTEAFPACLWLGYYFLLRFRNRHSRYHKLGKQMISTIISFMLDVLNKFANDTVSMEIFNYFSADVWGETVLWVEQVHDNGICKKQSAAVLTKLYDLKRADLPVGMDKHDALLQHLLEFYCF